MAGNCAETAISEVFQAQAAVESTRWLLLTICWEFSVKSLLPVAINCRVKSSYFRIKEPQKGLEPLMTFRQPAWLRDAREFRENQPMAWMGNAPTCANVSGVRLRNSECV